MSRLASYSLLALVTGACDPQGATGDFTVDQKIDGVDDADTRIQSVNPQMCVNSKGEVYVMWMDDRPIDGGTVTTGGSANARPVLWMNRSKSQGDPDTWLPSPSRINQGAGNVFEPKMICDDNGVYVVWEDDRDGDLQNHNIYFQRSVDGEVWLTDDVRVNNDPQGDTYSISPDIAIDASGNLFVVWADNQSGSYDILLATSSDNGATWGPNYPRVDQDFPGDAWSGRPAVAVDPTGQYVYVAWEDSRDGKSDIYFAYSASAGGSFYAEERLDVTLADADGASSSFEPQICADGSGPVYVLWHDAKNGEGYDIYYNYAPDHGATFLQSAAILETDTPGQNNSLFPQCVATGSKAFVAWQDNRYIGYDVFYRSVTDGIPDLEETRLDVGTQEGAANSLEVQLARFESTLVVGWTDGRAEAEANATATEVTTSGYSDLYYNWSDGGRFDAELDYRIDSLLPGQSYKESVNIAVLGGEIYAAWEDGRGGTSDIYFQRHLLGEQGTPPPVEEGSGTQP